MKENEVVLSHGVVSLLYTPSFFMPFLQSWCMGNGGAVVKARHVACSPDGSKHLSPSHLLRCRENTDHQELSCLALVKSHLLLSQFSLW